jgi:hypothetical protein
MLEFHVAAFFYSRVVDKSCQYGWTREGINKAIIAPVMLRESKSWRLIDNIISFHQQECLAFLPLASRFATLIRMLCSLDASAIDLVKEESNVLLSSLEEELQRLFIFNHTYSDDDSQCSDKRLFPWE